MRTPELSRDPKAYLVAVLAVAAATLVRLGLDPFLDEEVPYITFFATVIFAAWYGGPGPAIVAILLSYIAADWFFISPRYSLALSTITTKHLISASLFF